MNTPPSKHIFNDEATESSDKFAYRKAIPFLLSVSGLHLSTISKH